jgi:hypothetical protein
MGLGRLGIVVLVLGWAVGPALGQSVISAQGTWGMSAAPPIVPDAIILSGTGTAMNGAKYIDSSSLAQLNGTASETSATMGGDGFFNDWSREQTFTLSEPATVALPAFLTGTLTSTAGASGSLYAADITIYDSTGAAMGSVDDEGSAGGGASLPVVDKFLYKEYALAAGVYKIRARLLLDGSGPAMPDGSHAGADFMSTVAGGLESSFAAYPTGLGSSRDAVNAPAARTMFGVDGSGIKVGLLESGQPFTHTSLAGRLTTEAGAVAGDWKREHALATAGIIAAADASTANAGIAPGASIISGSSYAFGTTKAACDKLISDGVNVINMSATDGAFTAAIVNTEINTNPTVTFVKSAGNSGTAGSISAPGLAENVITVGALNRTFAFRASFSSFGAAAGTPEKPDIVAPGEYITAPQSRDVNGDGMLNDFGKVFLGNDFRGDIAQAAGGSATTGDITGTSFAAPHVAGAAALLDQYASLNAAHHSMDHRAIKAVLLNSASTAVTHSDGGAWTQTTMGSAAAHTLLVTRSLDQQLGAGKLDVLAAMKQFAPDEILDGHSNAVANFDIDTTGKTLFWDLETAVHGGGMVNYLLGTVGTDFLRATLTWDNDVSGGTGLMPLEFKLYEEGNLPNPVGFDAADTLIGSTSGAGENVKLFNFTIPDPGMGNNPDYYLQVINTGATDTEFGLAVSVPEPARLVLLAWALLLLTRGLRQQARPVV